jgi:hypothetical protein
MEKQRRYWDIGGEEPISANIANFHPLHTVVNTRAKISGDPIRDICNDTKTPVIVLVQTLGKFPTYDCLDTELLLQFPCKAFLGSFSVLDFSARKFPEPGEQARSNLLFE